jgi:flavoprotein
LFRNSSPRRSCASGCPKLPVSARRTVASDLLPGATVGSCRDDCPPSSARRLPCAPIALVRNLPRHR